MKRLSVYQRIMRASKRSTGIRISAQECFDLSLDGAISTRAELDDLGCDEENSRPERNAKP